MAQDNNKGADPSEDIRKQNAGETATGDIANGVDRDDPKKTEKLTKAGRDMDPDEGSD